MRKHGVSVFGQARVSARGGGAETTCKAVPNSHTRPAFSSSSETETANLQLVPKGAGGGGGWVGLGWVGLGQGLTWSPTHGPRRLPCRTRLGGRTRVSGHKAYRTVDRPRTPAVALAGGRCRRACVYVPLCV